MAPPPTNDLSLAQQSLGRAIGRARAGEDRELAQKVREGGEALAHVMAGLLKMSRVHAPDNRAFDAPVDQLARALDELVNLLGTVHLVAVEDQVYVNEVRIRAEGKGGARDLGAELARHNAGGLSFHAGLDGTAVRALVAGFAQKPAEVAPRRALQQVLFERGVRSVELAPRFRFQTQGEDQPGRRDPVEALLRTLGLVEETYDNLAAGRILNPLPLRRAVVEILEIGPETPELWENLGGGAPHATHAASVAIVALLVGKAAGLRPAALQDLGLAALIHDVGYAACPRTSAPGPRASCVTPRKVRESCCGSAVSASRSCAACARCSTTTATTWSRAAAPRRWVRCCASPRTTRRSSASTGAPSHRPTRSAR